MLGSKVRVCALGALVLGAGCSTGSSSSPSHGGASNAKPSRIPDMRSLDHDANLVDDAIDAELRVHHDDATLIPVEAVFRAPMPASAVDDFKAAGGQVRTILRGIGYGFTGRIARSAIPSLVPKLGSDLLLVKAEQKVELHLDESTRASRARAVWPVGFAGSTTGYNGSAKVNIAIIDTGVDATHPDLAGRLVGSKNFTSETEDDMRGHGSHVAGIALGSGVSFGNGPGTLAVTEYGSNAAEQPTEWVSAAYHLSASSVISGQSTFEGTSTTLSLLRANDGASVWSSIGTSAAQASPLSFSFAVDGVAGSRYTLGLRQNAGRDVKRFATAAKITNYPSVGDGYPALRGVAPLSGYYSAKIFAVSGEADSSDITAALQDIYDVREALDIKVVNCSFGLTGGGSDPAQRAKIAQLVDHGVIVVASSGNSGINGSTGDPGRTAVAITVGATNDLNQLSSFSSGATKLGGTDDTDDKPDLVAPGGSSQRSKILSVDSNWNDSGSTRFADVQPNDYSSNLGTSMAAPIVSGAAALLVQALEAKGRVWSFDSNEGPLLVKMLLLATATETNQARETNAGNPVLGRAESPKDVREGFGIVNVDAAIEAATLDWDMRGPLAGSTNGSPGDRRAWARKITVPKGQSLKLALSSTPNVDFDLHVYSSTPSATGSPKLQTWSTREGLGLAEQTTGTFAEDTELYAVVKRIAGSGSFTLTGQTFTCGNDAVEAGEECDDGNPNSGDCCSSACQFEETVACGFPEPNGVVDAGSDDGGSDAGDAGDAGEADADASVPPVEEPPPPSEPPPTPPPTATAVPTFRPSTPVERLEPGGGGCSTSGSSSSAFGGLGLALAALTIVRRRRSR